MFRSPATITLSRKLVVLARVSIAQKAAETFQTSEFQKTLTQVHSYLRAGNAYRRFVKDFFRTEKRLTNMTRKDARPDFTSSTEAQREASEILRHLSTSLPVLAPHEHCRLYVLDCDASAYQLGCKLLQRQPDRTFYPSVIGHIS